MHHERCVVRDGVCEFFRDVIVVLFRRPGSNFLFPRHSIIRSQIFVSYMHFMHEKEAPASEAVYVNTFIYGIDRAAKPQTEDK